MTDRDDLYTAFYPPLPRLELHAERQLQAWDFTPAAHDHLQAVLLVWHQRTGIDVEHADDGVLN